MEELATPQQIVYRSLSMRFCHWLIKEVYTVANSYRDPGFIVTLTTYLTDVLCSFRNILITLSIQTLANILIAIIAIAVITTVFRISCQGKPPWQIGPLQVKAWIVPSTVCFILTLPILFL